MNRSNIRTRRADEIQLDDLVFARSDHFYFLEFTKYSSEIFNTNSVIGSKPSLIFYTKDAEQHVIVDYSLAKSEDKLYLNTFFSGMIPGTTFTFSNGEYLDEARDINANLSSVLEYTEYKTDMIFCKVNSVTDLNSAINLYSAYYFINTPQISKAGSLQNSEDTEIQALVFSNPRTAKPLLWLGYQPGDYIQILNPNSVNNTLLMEILDVLFINGKEILKLRSNQIITENLIGQDTIVNLFLKSKIQGLLTDYTNDQTSPGCCVNTALNIALPQHTEIQCALRGGGFVYNNGNCYGSLKTLISPITGDALLTEEEKQQIVDPLQQAMMQVFDYRYLDEYYKKKITYLDANGVQLSENNSLVTDYKSNIIPLINSSLENIIAINAEQALSGVQVLSHIPKNIVQSFTEIDGVTLIADAPIYRILNIHYEAYVTDTDVVVKGLGGVPLQTDAIPLNKNVLTTIFETNLSTDDNQRLVFSSSKEMLSPVVDFKLYGYDYLQIGRYHIITPITNQTKPLFVWSTRLNRADQYIYGIVDAAYYTDKALINNLNNNVEIKKVTSTMYSTAVTSL